MAHALAAIDWRQPWFAPLAAIGQPVAANICKGMACNQALNACAQAPVRFVPQACLPPGEAYEKYIFSSGNCPTREGLHDFFNGLCWIRFPATKKRLNRLQAAQIERDGIKPERGAVRDALTLFDENAAFLQAPQVLWDALAAKNWQALFVDLRPLWQEARLTLFGHALLEKLASPRKAITAHVYQAHAAIESISSQAAVARLDGWMAADLSAGKLAGKPFAHLPVLGVPGWWAANEDPGFYEDPAVFRPPKPPNHTYSHTNGNTHRQNR